MTQNPLATVEPWDLVAAGYTRALVPVFQKWARDTFEQVSLHSDDRVLDIACGPGTVSLLAASLAKDVVALDFSENMIAALRDEIGRRGISNIVADVCDCQSLPLTDNQFDAVFSQFGLMFFPNRIKGFTEAFRVLKPGGRISVVSWAPVEQSESMSMMIGALEAGFAAHMATPQTNRNIVKGLDDRETFLGEMARAGFESVEIREVAHSFQADAPQQFWESMADSSAPIVLMRSRISEGAWREGEARAIEYISQQLSGKDRLYSAAYLACGRKPSSL